MSSNAALSTSSRPRLYLGTAFFSAWMVLLLCGFAFGGAVHLLLLLALVLFPWRAAAADDGPEERS